MTHTQDPGFTAMGREHLKPQSACAELQKPVGLIYAATWAKGRGSKRLEPYNYLGTVWRHMCRTKKGLQWKWSKLP